MSTGKSRRAALSAGLGLSSLIALPEVAFAQDPAVKKPDAEPAEVKGDGDKTSGSKTSFASSIGVVDIESIIKDSRKIQAANEQIKVDATSKQNDLQKIVQKGKELAEDLGRLTPGTPEHDRLKERLQQIGAQLEGEKKKAQQEFSSRESRELASIYKEIEKHVEAIARSRGIGLILRLSANVIDANQPQSVMSALARAVVFADPRLDITAEVRNRLNRR